MSNANGNESQTESMLSNLLKFFFIFFILVIVVLSIHFAGFLNSEETSPSTPPASIQTLPSTTTAATASSATVTTTEAPTTETSPVITTASTTAEVVTYPPATVPTNDKTTATTRTTATTEEPPVLGPLDISDQAMSELIDVRLLSIDDDSRPGYKLWSVKNIVVHYVANPGSTADQNWRHFENNKPGTSAHFIIGLEGEIIQCIPLDEVAWAIGTKDGNYTSISIECCHPDDSGKFTAATYESLVRLVSWLCKELDLDRDDVIRHYDYPRYTSSGMEWHKECPLYYADADDPESHKRWEAFKNDLILD